MNIDVQHTNQIKLTVNSTFQSFNLNNPEASSAETGSTTSVQTNICKQEPNEPNPQPCNNNNNNPTESVIQNLMKSLQEKLPASMVMNALEEDNTLESKGGFCKDLTSGNKNLQLPGMDQENDVKVKEQSAPYTEGAFEDTPTSVLPNMTGGGGMGNPNMVPAGYQGNVVRPPVNSGTPTSPILGDTGPAAETLKQMAAQHQNQESTHGYEQYQRNPHNQYAYPGQFHSSMPGMPAQANSMYYNNQANPHMANYPRPARHGYDGSNKDLSYGETKRLTHYPVDSTGQIPSSLQQLQNQVQSHFSQGSAAQESNPTQSHVQMNQQVNMSHNGQRVYMSQSQRMDVHAPSNQHNISMAQQQSFQMGSPNQHQYVQEMYKQQQQQRTASSVPQSTTDPSYMSEYMNRPPPVYKPGPGYQNSSSMTPGSQMTNASSPTNPLETMQNMVNQTSPAATVESNGIFPPHHSGRSMKQEPNSEPTLQHPAQRASPTIATTSANRPTSSSKSAAPTYTSAIMRNQRAPNVNVGPHGLNISQQRTPQMMDWSQRGVPAGMNPAMMGQSVMPGQMSMSQAQQIQSAQRASLMQQYGPNASYNNGMMQGMTGQRMRMAQPSHQTMSMHQSQAMSSMGSHNGMMQMQPMQHMQMQQQSANVQTPGGMMQQPNPTELIPQNTMGSYPQHGMSADYAAQQQQQTDFMSAATATAPPTGAAPPYFEPSTSSEYFGF